MDDFAFRFVNFYLCCVLYVSLLYISSLISFLYNNPYIIFIFSLVHIIIYAIRFAPEGKTDAQHAAEDEAEYNRIIAAADKRAAKVK